jgi:predicted RNA binding protein YcfA (HicA-like mRNA interferase family)
MNAKEVEKILKKNGFHLKSTAGSHKKYVKDNKIVIVPYHGTKDINIKTLKSIERQSGLKLR